MNGLKTAIIGCGAISGAHFEPVRNSADLVAVCDTNKARANQYAEQFNCQAYYSVEELIAAETIDIAHLLTPHNVRADVIQQLACAGINILTEKPVGMTLTEGLKVLDIAKTYSNIKVGVVFQNRYNHTTTKLQELLRHNILGEIYSIRGQLTWNRTSSYYADAPWRMSKKTAGGGVLINQAIHTLDLIQLLGGEIEDIHSSAHRFRHTDYDIEDTANIFIHFANGVEGSLYATVANGTDSPVELEIAGEKGRLLIANYALWLDKGDGQLEKICDDSASGEKAYYGGSHGIAIHQFQQAVIENSHDYISVNEALKSLEIIESVYQNNPI